MRIDLWVGITALVVAVGALAVAIYAITDVRKLVRRYVIEAQRDAVYIEATNRLCWQFIEPHKGGEVYSPEMVILFQRFFMLQEALDSNATPQSCKEVIENAALETASDIVDNQKAEWKQDLDFDRVRAMLKEWRDGKAKVRMSRIFQGKNRTLEG